MDQQFHWTPWLHQGLCNEHSCAVWILPLQNWKEKEKEKRCKTSLHFIALCKANNSAKTEESKTPSSPFAQVLRDPAPPA